MANKFGYYDMLEIIKPCEKGRFKIQHYTPTSEQVIDSVDRWAKVGITDLNNNRLVVLYDNDITRHYGHSQYSVVMSSDTMEHQSCKVFNDTAYGDVMLGGLGIGMVTIPLLHNPKVTRITHYEKYPNIIDMVKPQLDSYIEKHNLPKKFHVLHRDIANPDYSIPKHDVIWIDIWNEMSAPNRLREMKLLKRKYKKHLNKNGKILWWGQNEFYMNK